MEKQKIMKNDKQNLFNPEAVKCWVSGFGGGNPTPSEKVLEREAAAKKKKKARPQTQTGQP